MDYITYDAHLKFKVIRVEYQDLNSKIFCQDTYCIYLIYIYYTSLILSKNHIVYVLNLFILNVKTV